LLSSVLWGVATLPLQAQTDAVRVVESSESQNTVMEEKATIRFSVERAAQLTITVDDAIRYQAIERFGASLTDSSAWLLKNKLTESQRKDALEMLFGYWSRGPHI
jgi:glucosylceramidase